MLGRIEARLRGRLWEMLPGTYDSFLSRLQRADDPVGPSYWGECVHPQVITEGALAVMPVHGVLGRNFERWEIAWYGAYDLCLMEHQLENIAADERVETVLMDFRSPGGMAGCWTETVALMNRVKAETGKQFIGYTNDVCASAAMPLACACDAFFVSPSSAVGSMGTMISGIDSSGAFAQAGLQRVVITSGTLKALGMSGKAWTDEEMAHLAQEVAQLSANYQAAILAGRPEMPQEVFRTAQVYQGQMAPAGLHDGLVDRLEELVAEVV